MAILYFSTYLAQGVLVPLITLIGFNESLVMTFVFSTITARHFIKAFAAEAWMFYLGNIL